jgi:hypothetical protein
MVTTKEEYNIFRQYVKKLVDRGIIKPNVESNPGSEEDMADVIADLRTGRTEKYKPNSFVKRIINKINEFVDRFKEAFGVRTTSGLVRDITSGQIFYGTGVNKTSLNTPSLPSYSLERNVKSFIGTVASTFSDHPEDMPKETVQMMSDFIKGDKKESMSALNYALNLPFRLSQKFPEWKEIWRIHGIDRPENRSFITSRFIAKAAPFFEMGKNLKAKGYTKEQVAESKDKIERVLIAGDTELHDRLISLKESLTATKDKAAKDHISAQIDRLQAERRYNAEELAAGIKDRQGNTVSLNPDEIEIYNSVRESLDNVMNEMGNWLIGQSLRSYKNHKWFNILLAATDFNLNTETLKELLGNKGLSDAAIARTKKIQVNVRNVFDRLEEGIKTVPEKELQNVSATYERIASTMTNSLAEMKEYLGIITNTKDQKELDKLARNVFAAYIQTRPQLKAIKNLRNQMKDWIGYFPRYREGGKYKLRLLETLTDEDGNILLDENDVPLEPKLRHSSFINNTQEGKEVYTKILNEFGKDGKLPENFKVDLETLESTPEGAFEGVTDTNMQKVFDVAMEHLKVKGIRDISGKFIGADGQETSVLDEIKNAGYEAIANQFKSRGAMRSTIHRGKGDLISGFSETNLDNVLLNYMGSMAGLMTKQTAAMDALELLKNVKNKSQYSALNKYNREMLRNESTADKLAGKLRSFGFLWFLGGMLKAPIINITQNPIVGFSELAKFQREHNLGGAGKADVEYMKAMKDVLADNLTEPEKKFIDEMISKGIATDQYIQSIFEGVRENETIRKYLSVAKFLAKPFSMSEVYNRKSAAIAIYRTAYNMRLKEALASGLNQTDAENQAYEKTFDDARTFIDNVHYAYGKTNRPLWMMSGDVTSAALSAAYTFRGFTHNFLARQAELLSQKDFKTMLHTLAYIGMFGGLMGLPFFKDLFEFMEKQYGYSPVNSIRKTLRGVGGETLEKMGISGLPSVIGANISGSIATGLPWPIGAPSPESSVFGVWSGMGQKVVRSAQAAARGDIERMITEASPEFFRNPRVAARESGIGKELFGMPGYSTNTRGRAMLDEEGKPISMTAVEAATKALGFNPTNYARAKEKNQTVLRQVEWANNAKEDIAEEYRIALVKNDPDALKNMIKGVASVNTSIRNRGLQYLVTPMTVRNVIQSSRPQHGMRQIREAAYKQTL